LAFTTCTERSTRDSGSKIVSSVWRWSVLMSALTLARKLSVVREFETDGGLI
jgi:hypothetical protein